jgi:hypothetical protein
MVPQASSEIGEELGSMHAVDDSVIGYKGGRQRPPGLHSGMPRGSDPENPGLQGMDDRFELNTPNYTEVTGRKCGLRQLWKRDLATPSAIHEPSRR